MFRQYSAVYCLSYEQPVYLYELFCHATVLGPMCQYFSRTNATASGTGRTSCASRVCLNIELYDPFWSHGRSFSICCLPRRTASRQQLWQLPPFNRSRARPRSSASANSTIERPSSASLSSAVRLPLQHCYRSVVESPYRQPSVVRPAFASLNTRLTVTISPLDPQKTVRIILLFFQREEEQSVGLMPKQ